VTNETSIDLVRASFAQERVWFIERLSEGQSGYVIVAALGLTGAIDQAKLGLALAEVIRRHETLRTNFTYEGAELFQVIRPARAVSLDDRTIDSDLRSGAGALAAELAEPAWDLENDALLRAQLVRSSSGGELSLLLIAVHHIVSDGWSMGVLARELITTYLGGEATLPALEIQYADYAHWQRSMLEEGALDDQLAFWRERLAEPVEASLPTDHPRPSTVSYRGGSIGVALSASTTSHLHRFAKREGVTPFMVLLAAYSLVIARLSGSDDVAVGTPIANRNRPELEPLIGFFANTLSIRTRVTPAMTFRELLAAVRQTCLDAYANQDVPFERLVEELQPERNLGRPPFFQTMLALQNAPLDPIELPGLTVELFDVPSWSAKFDLLLSCTLRDGALRGQLEYSSELFDEDTVRALWNRVARVLTAAMDRPERRCGRLPLLDAVEREAVLAASLGPERAAPVAWVTTRIAAVAESKGEATAVEMGAASLSYRELFERACGVAHALVERGGGPNSVCAIALPRGPELMVAVLGVLLSGSAYVPIDPTYPADRRRFMLAESRARWLFASTDDELDAEGVALMPTASLNAPRQAPPDVTMHAEGLGYVIFTSGSTGRPKGIAMTRRSLGGLIDWQLRRSRDPAARTLQFTSLSFDVSFQEIIATWCAGGTLVLVDEMTRRDPKALLDLLEDARVERLFLPFVALNQLVEQARHEGRWPTNLTEVVTAGEQLRVTPTMRGVLEQRGVVLDNHYGPAETHVVTAERLGPEETPWPALPDIGRPLPNTAAYVLDQDMELLPNGAVGTLFIGGDAVARGYLGRPSLTASRFRPSPFGDGGRLYDTGDVVRRGVDGRLAFIGRADAQVKIRGYRVEPGEIENVLAAHPAVREAVVVARGTGVRLELLAYVVATGDDVVAAAELRDFARDRLPDYAVPSAFTLLDALPLTPSGKIARRQLPVPDDRSLVEAGGISPRNEAEQAVADAVAEVLDLAQVGVDASFFELGGHSLLAMQLVSRLRDAFGFDVPVRAVFEAPRIADLARRLASGASETSTASIIPRASREEPLPLSFAQERIWFLQQLAPNSTTYNVAAAVRLTGRIDDGLLGDALGWMVDRHEALRTRFGEVVGEPRQWIDERGDVALNIVTISQSDDADAALSMLAKQEVGHRFDLARGPLLRATLVRHADERQVFFLSMHHIVTDGWSLALIVRELMTRYQALLAGEVSPSEPPRLHYADYAAWERSLGEDARVADVEHFRRALDGAPPSLDLPLDHARPAMQTFRGGSVRASVPLEVQDRIRALTKAAGATAFMTMLAAFGGLMGRLSGQRDVVVGAPVANRQTTELEQVVGCFINVLPLRVRWAEGRSFRDLLTDVRQTTVDAYAHQQLRFEQLVDALEPPRDPSRTPLFQVAFNMLNFGMHLEARGLDVELYEIEVEDAKFDLTLYVHEIDGRTELTLVFNRALLNEASAREMLEQYQQLLRLATLSPDLPLDDFDLVTEGARPRLPNPRSAPAAPCPSTVLELVMERLRERPEAGLIRRDEGVLRAADLDRLSAAVARRLRADGVGPGDRVAVLASRSAELATALIGCWRAGASFTVMDPDYPRERLARQVELAAPRCLIALRDTGDLDDFGVPCWTLHHGDRAWQVADDGQSEALPSPTAEAYVAFTSGTTGEPLGIVGHHGPLAHYLTWSPGAFELSDDDRFGLLSGLAHDPLLRDLFLPLFLGATLSIPAPDVLADAPRLFAWLERERVTVLHLTPAMGETILLGAPAGASLPLRRTLFGGDHLSPDLVARWRALAPDGVVTNAYGATETPQVMSWHSPRVDGARVGIGRGTKGVDVLVLTGGGQLAGIGEPGEVVIRTPHLAASYLQADAPSRFSVNPLRDDPTDRVFRTGDLGRYRHDGSVELVGRIDQQVKVRGFRVELDEVRRALIALDAVDEAEVMVAGEADRRRMIGCVVAQPGSTAAALSVALRERLPAYMVPAAIVIVEAIPKTPNFKLDRAAVLTLASASDTTGGGGRPPTTDLERRVATMWARALGADEGRLLGLDTNFFEAGGHSLLATRLLAALRRELGVTLGLRAFLQSPRLGSMVAAIAESRHGAGDLQRLPELQPDADKAHEPFALTDVQQAYVVGRRGDFELGGVSTHAYIELEAPTLDLPRFERALNAAIDRHPALRIVVGDDGMQRVLGTVPNYVVATLDLSDALDSERLEALEDVRADMSHQVLPEGRWPLFEVRATTWAGGLRLHLSIDALILDAWSRNLVAQDVLLAYRDPTAAPPPLSCTFRDYVVALGRFRETEAFAQAEAYWDARIEEFPGPPELPLAKSPSQVDKPRFVSRTLTIDAERWRALKERAASRSLTASTVVLAAYSEIVGTWSSSPHFAMNVTLFNRLPVHEEVHHVAGDFTTLELLAVDLRRGEGFAGRAAQIQERLWTDLDHSVMGGLEVTRKLRQKRRSAEVVAPVVFTSTLGFAQPSTEDFGDLFEVGYTVSQTPQVWLDNVVSEDGAGNLQLRWNSIDELFPADMVPAMFAELERLLLALADDDRRWTRDEALLPPADAARRRAVNATEGLLSDRLLHELARRPDRGDALAVVDHRLRLSHRELAERVAALAEAIAPQVDPGTLVGVVMTKGWEQVVAVLAILELGGVYVPIQASLPEERIHYLFETTNAALCLTQAHVRDAGRWPEGLPVVAVDELGLAPAAAREPSRRGDDLAYVIFTSGSTGLPKGVMIPHRGAVNTIEDINDRFTVGEDDRVLALSSLSFDLSVYDVFGLLGAGGALVLPSPDDLRDPASWARLLTRERVTIWNSVPALMLILVEYLESHPEAIPRDLRVVMMSGDWIPVQLPNRIRALMPDCKVISLGGATEGSIWSIIHPIESVDPDWVSIPYGRPMRNQTFHVLAHDMRARPTWVPGELYIGGVGVAQGYWQAPDKTAAQFVDDPRSGEPLYRTGDWGRYLPSGDIEFLGRQDTQVKIQGYRIELGEVEHALDALDEVEVSVALPLGPPNARRLVAYVVLADASVDPATLRTRVGAAIPAYMVPQRITVVDSLPLSSNGKVDRKALKALSETDGQARQDSSAAETTALEQRIARLLEEVLELEIAGPDANLLELGADSIGIIRAANRLEKEFALRPRLVEVYRDPTVRALARLYHDHVPALDEPSAETGYARIDDPDERSDFKKRALRQLVKAPSEGVALPHRPASASRFTRRTWRAFADRAIPIERLAEVLATLAAAGVDDSVKFLYPSAGGLYAVRLLVYVAEGRVTGLDPGVYAYHALTHQLVPHRLGVVVDPVVYGPLLNGPIFASSAFALHFVCQRDVLVPMYGDKAPRFAAIEAGLMSGLVEQRGADFDIGFCHVGGIDEEEIAASLGLDADQQLVHTLVGGTPENREASWTPYSEARAQDGEAAEEDEDDGRETFEL
jgi:amino acid adenylation domain-containing protein